MSAMLASFPTEAALAGALDRLRAAGLEELETYSPVPVLSEAAPRKARLIPASICAAGVFGTAFMFGLETLSTASNWGYPVDIGGRPPFSWPAYIPIAIPFGLLCAGLASLLLFVVGNTAWRLWDPVDEFEQMPAASRDRWIVHVHVEDERELARARAVLGALAPEAVRLMSHDLEEVPA